MHKQKSAALAKNAAGVAPISGGTAVIGGLWHMKLSLNPSGRVRNPIHTQPLTVTPEALNLSRIPRGDIRLTQAVNPEAIA